MTIGKSYENNEGKKPSQFGLRRQCKQCPHPPELVLKGFDDVLSEGST